MKQGMHCYISGKVQGVWFRAHTKQEANRLGLLGWVRNLPDGRVEVLAYGEQEQLQQFHHWLKKGPPLANVIEASCEIVEWESCSDFAIK